MSNLNIHQQYLNYLELGDAKEEQMHPTQRIEMKRAFMGGMASMLTLMHTDVAEMSEEEGVRALDFIKKQLDTYWNGEVANHNKQKDDKAK